MALRLDRETHLFRQCALSPIERDKLFDPQDERGGDVDDVERAAPDYRRVAGGKLIGGAAICLGVFRVVPHHYWSHARDFMELWDIGVSMFKPAVFGGLIALISCHRGFHSRGGSEGVGRAATEAFVLSFLSILVLMAGCIGGKNANGGPVKPAGANNTNVTPTKLPDGRDFAATKETSSRFWSGASPLLEEESDLVGATLVPNFKRPSLVHRPCFGTTFAANDRPVDTLKIDFANRAQKWLE